MDPKETLRLAKQAWEDHDLVTCLEHLSFYANWKMNGGFSDQEDDHEIVTLVARIASIKMEREARFVAALDDADDQEQEQEEGEV